LLELFILSRVTFFYIATPDDARERTETCSTPAKEQFDFK